MSRIIFLHGASSSGKSTLAAAIRAMSGRPWLHLSIDHLRDSGAWRPQDDPGWPASRARFFDGFHRAAAAFAAAGNDLILEHILDTAGWQQQLQDLLAAHRLLFVAVLTPPQALADRERRRGNRNPGSALRDAAAIHEGRRYDLTLDGCRPAEENAAEILAALEVQTRRSAFFAAKTGATF